jgi:CSLREA domain-containing protein
MYVQPCVLNLHLGGRMKKTLLLLVFLFVCLAAAGCGPALVVDSAGDEPDSNLSDGVCKTVNNDCTLRAAIMEAELSDDISKITFDSNLTISPATNLPPLTANNTQIRGGGQTIILDGTQNTEYPQSGILILDSKNNIIQGLKIRNFLYGIHILSDAGEASNNIIGMSPFSTDGSNEHNTLVYNYVGLVIEGKHAFDNVVSGNYIGVASDGITASPNEYGGVQIREEANHNLIGSLTGDTVADGGNLISGNGSGVKLDYAEHNHISGNYIGTQESGNAELSNGIGIKVAYGSSNNIIGIDDTGEGQPNLISGNNSDGIYIENSDYSIIAGNFIGVNSTGTSALPNRYGIYLYLSSFNIIGTGGDGVNDANEGNLISGNNKSGIAIFHNNSIYNVIAGNKIGTNFDGSTSIGNGSVGVSTSGDFTIIGTNGDGISDSLEGNLISGNNQAIGLNSTGSRVSGNIIGLDLTGTTDITQTGAGISLSSNSSQNLVGTDGDGQSDDLERNIISGLGSGISLNGSQSNSIAGNYIGTDINGTFAIPNGVNTPGGRGAINLVNGSNNNIIGTNGDGLADNVEGNLISGNFLRGIVFDGSSNNVVAGNMIGTDISGSSVLGNTLGILIKDGSSHNLIGTNGDGTSDFIEGNVISGSTDSSGIQINGSQNQISGNYIGTNKSGLTDLGNNTIGITVTESATDILIGGLNHQTNTIAFNNQTGILIYGPSVNDIQILSNSIFSNGYNGIDLAGTLQETGVSHNDPGDLDSGPNDLMNFPVLSNAASVTGFIGISGEMINSLPFTSYQLQFFNNDECDPGGYGEGKTYLGSKQVFTDSYGNASFSATFSGIVHAGDFITATATAYGKTSEFSACVEVTAGEESYSGEFNENPCDQFNQSKMSFVTFNYRPGSGMFSLYVKNPESYPKEGPTGTWDYTAVLGEFPSSLTSFLDFDDRIYFDFQIPENYINSTQKLMVFSNYCFPPFYVNEEVNIFAKGPDDPAASDDPVSCHEDLGKLACEAVGGEYKCVAACTCVCP